MVNEEGKTLENVTVTDTFRAGNGTNKVSGSDHEMAFVSASEALDASSDAENGKLVFKFDKLDAKKVITIVTKVKDPTAFDASSWPLFENKASMTSDMNTTPIDSTAQTWQQIKKPDILAKDGKMNGDGTITWTLRNKSEADGERCGNHGCIAGRTGICGWQYASAEPIL